MYGSTKAEIDGDVKLEKSCVNSSNGVFGPMEYLLGNVKDIKDFIGNAKEVYENITKGDFLGAIEGGISVAKQGCDLVGIDYGKKEEGFDGYKGTVNQTVLSSNLTSIFIFHANLHKAGHYRIG